MVTTRESRAADRELLRRFGFTEKPLTRATRHTLLVYLELLGRYQQFQVDNPEKSAKDHFNEEGLLKSLATKVSSLAATTITPGKVLAHLLYISGQSEHGLVSYQEKWSRVRGQPQFTPNRWGETLFNHLEGQGYRPYMEGPRGFKKDAPRKAVETWQALLVLSAMTASGPGSPSSLLFSTDALVSRTRLNEGQIRNALVLISKGFTAKARSQTNCEFPGGCLEIVKGEYKIVGVLRMADPDDFDFEDIDPPAPKVVGADVADVGLPDGPAYFEGVVLSSATQEMIGWWAQHINLSRREALLAILAEGVAKVSETRKRIEEERCQEVQVEVSRLEFLREEKIQEALRLKEAEEVSRQAAEEIDREITALMNP